MVLYRPPPLKKESPSLPTIKEQIDIPQYNCISFCSSLPQTNRSCVHLSNRFIRVLCFLLFCPSPSCDFGLLSGGKISSEKSTWTLDEVPPAGPGCQAGRILVDSMISHGNEREADIHALNYMTLRPRYPQSRLLLLVQPPSPYLRVKL